jgi:tRNA pseudouridine55 synthase
VIARSDARPTDAEIKEALHSFVGDIEQVPPAFSAVKIDGQRAYAKARAGEEVELAARPLWVESLILLERADADHAKLEMVCGKGGYVRSIARDLGEKLGCLGHVRELRRVWSGPFAAGDGVTLREIEAEAKSEALDRFLRPLEDGLADLPRVTCSAEAAGRLRNGNPAPVIASGLDYGEEAWAAHEGRAVAVGRMMGPELHPSRVFVL